MRNFFLVMCGVFILGSACVLATEDLGYFLSWQQKKELIGLGRMQDSEGVWYDVWLCPGYVPPAQSARENFKKSGANFHEYVEADKYRSLAKDSKACFDWALKDCGAGFIVKGIPRAWDRYFSVAHDRSQRRVFGWWLAYPWALMESSADMAFRGIVGSSGVAAGMACGTAVVPTYRALDSAIEGSWNLGIKTVLLPAIAITWNTAVSPPLALIGQKPSKSRVDGFWVTMIDPPPRELSPEDIRLLGRWGQLLLEETRPFEQKQKEIDADACKKEDQLRYELRAVRDAASRKRDVLEKEKKANIHQALSTSDPILILPECSSRDVSGNNQRIRRYLREQGVSVEETGKILDLLVRYGVPRTVDPASARKKTDPFLRGVEVVGESAEDLLPR